MAKAADVPSRFVRTSENVAHVAFSHAPAWVRVEAVVGSPCAEYVA